MFFRYQYRNLVFSHRFATINNLFMLKIWIWNGAFYWLFKPSMQNGRRPVRIMILWCYVHQSAHPACMESCLFKKPPHLPLAKKLKYFVEKCCLAGVWYKCRMVPWWKSDPSKPSHQESSRHGDIWCLSSACPAGSFARIEGNDINKRDANCWRQLANLRM